MNAKLDDIKSRRHRPDCVLIDAYGNGGFRFEDMSHQGSLFITPAGMFPWEASEKTLSQNNFEPFLELLSSSDVLLIGTGKKLVGLSPDLRNWFKELELFPDIMDTGAAARTYNVLLMEKRLVSAALVQV